jgi:hypothetical protein
MYLSSTTGSNSPRALTIFDRTYKPKRTLLYWKRNRRILEPKLIGKLPPNPPGGAWFIRENDKSTLGLFVRRRKFVRYLIRVTGYLIRVTGCLIRVTSPDVLSKV